ncbi:MAG: GNAT family N-acetyltransferase [Chloroflexi bacterium]|nr:GNAT family N-acetyltransferase [Chloroflexota bacterium]
MLDLVTLEGRHVLLEPLSLDHIPGLVQAANQSRDTYGFTYVPEDADAMRLYVETALAGQDAGNTLPFATIDRHTERVAGSTRFHHAEFWDWPAGNPHQRGKQLPDVVHIGTTWLAADAQRTGINTEAKLLMLTHAFESWLVHRVRIQADSRNERSRRAIERLGAHLDGVVRADRVALDGAIRDSAVFSILDSEWPAVKNRLAALLH